MFRETWQADSPGEVERPNMTKFFGQPFVGIVELLNVVFKVTCYLELRIGKTIYCVSLFYFLPTKVKSAVELVVCSPWVLSNQTMVKDEVECPVHWDNLEVGKDSMLIDLMKSRYTLVMKDYVKSNRSPLSVRRALKLSVCYT